MLRVSLGIGLDLDLDGEGLGQHLPLVVCSARVLRVHTYEGTFDGDPKRYFESRGHASDYLERSGFVLWENKVSGGA